MCKAWRVECFLLKTGIIGARGVGKSTVFHALTGLAPLAGQGEGRNRARPGQIKVADERLDFLERTYGSKKRVEVELTVLDFAPNPKEQKEGAALDPSLLPLIRDLDARLIVIPAFAENPAALPAALAAIEAELVFADLDQGERRLERLTKERNPASEFERVTLQRCVKWLEEGKPLRSLEMTAQELIVFASFGLLSRKPALVVVNCDAERAGAAPASSSIEAAAAHGMELFGLAAAFEAELWELDAGGQRELLSAAGVSAPARGRPGAGLSREIRLITFYTAGEPEE